MSFTECESVSVRGSQFASEPCSWARARDAPSRWLLTAEVKEQPERGRNRSLFRSRTDRPVDDLSEKIGMTVVSRVVMYQV